jgi:hypothetical protein
MDIVAKNDLGPDGQQQLLTSWMPRIHLGPGYMQVAETSPPVQLPLS